MAAEILYIEYIYIIKFLIKLNILNIPTHYILSRNISHNNSKRSRIKYNLHLLMPNMYFHSQADLIKASGHKSNNC